jgi:FtsZ-interacting cell division protein ZipA
MENITNTTNALLVNATQSSDQPQVVNFALNGKMLVNGSDNGRIIMNANNELNASSPVMSMPVMLVLMFVIASIVGVIVTALFVMRRRFSTWRLNMNNSKTDNNNSDPETGDVKEEIKSEEKVKPEESETEIKKDEIYEKKVDEPTSIDTKTAEMNKEGQASPSSNSPLINNTEVTTTESIPVTQEEIQKPVDQVTSSSSLIVNVLNELSESVACKLAGEANADPEKEPLNDQQQK